MISDKQDIKVDSHCVSDLLVQIKREKETLVSMFLANASIAELAAQYKLIDELNTKIINTSSGRS